LTSSRFLSFTLYYGSKSGSILSLPFLGLEQREDIGRSSHRKHGGIFKALYSINLLSSSLQLQLRCKRCTGIWTLQHLQYRVRLNCKVAFPTEVLPYFIVRVCFHTEVRTHVSVGDLALIVRGVKCAVRLKNWPTLPG